MGSVCQLTYMREVMFIDKSNKQGCQCGRQQDKRLRQQAALALDMLVVLPDYTISLEMRDEVGG